MLLLPILALWWFSTRVSTAGMLQRDRWGILRTPLMVAIVELATTTGELERLQAVRRLAISGGSTSLNWADKDGFTALHIAVHHQLLDVAALLLAAKADPNASAHGAGGRTPLLMLAIEFPVYSYSPARAQQLRRKDCPLDIAKLLLEARADPNEVRKAPAGQHRDHTDGDTALMCAASTGHAELVKQLLSAKADPSIERGDGATALELAETALNPHLEAVHQDKYALILRLLLNPPCTTVIHPGRSSFE
jgi:ankyrin repeat protein